MKDPQAMTYQELKTWLADWLQMKPTVAADINTRRDEAAYEKPAEIWRTTNGEFRNEFKRAILDLISEASALPWMSDNFNQLCRLVESANLWEAVSVLENVAESRHMLETDEGIKRHSFALRTLLALDWTGTPAFWLGQKEIIGEFCPALVFEGLMRQDIEIAFKQLHQLAPNRAAMRQILDLFPGLMRNLPVSIRLLRRSSLVVIKELDLDAASALYEWFDFQHCPLSPNERPINLTIFRALRNTLSGQSEPRYLSPMLLGVPDHSCLPA